MSRPTRLSDLTGIVTPADAPGTIRFPAALVSVFERLRRNSYPGGRSKEQGGTIVADGKGTLLLQNVGGLASTAGTFTPDDTVRDPAHFTAVGVFHTHPYDRSEGSIHGVSFSGGDISTMVDSGLLLDVVQSGPRLFATLRTGATPATAPATLDDTVNADIQTRVDGGRTFQQASRIEAQQTAALYGLAYYQGRHGVVTRV